MKSLDLPATRLPTGNQDASIEDQIRLCRARIELEGWQYRAA
jgi:hypothetical protein